MLAKLSAAIALAALTALAQPVPKDAKPVSFEVASLKPAAPGAQGGIIRPARGNQSYIATNMSLRILIRIAYGVSDRQLTGGPAWIDTTNFDMDAKAEKPATMDELHLMLRSLLEERFKLKVHMEDREEAVYNLVVDKSGHKMKVHEPVETDFPPIAGGGLNPRQAVNAHMSYFAFYLSQNIDRWVIDKTNLDERFDFSILFRPNVALPPDAPAEAVSRLAELPDVFTALKDQLGLRLEQSRGPVPHLVIDKVEKLIEN